MAIEGRDRDAGQRPDVVEVDLAGQHVEQRLVGRRLGHLDDQLLLVARRRAKPRGAGIGIAGDAEGVLVTRDRGDAGIERRAHGQQIARRLQGLAAHFMLGIDPHAIAPDGQRRSDLVHELADAGLAAFGIDDRFGEQLGLARQPGSDALFEAHAHGFERPRARWSAPGPIELPQDALEEIIRHHAVDTHVRGSIPTLCRRMTLGKSGAQGAVLAVLHIVAHCRMRRCQRVRRSAYQLIDKANRFCRFGINAAPAKDQVHRIAQAFIPAPVQQQARQALGAAIAGHQPQADLGLAEARHRFGDAVMAGERELHPPAQRHALHRRDAGFAHLLDRAEGEVRIVGQHHRLFDRVDFLEHLADIRARDKGGCALAGEHHRHDIIVARQGRGHHHQLVNRTFVECIDRRVGDGDGRDLLAGGDAVVLHEEIAVAIEQRLLVAHPLLALPVSYDGAQFVQRLGVAQRRDVADILAHHQRADHAAHIFAAAGLGELRDFDEVGGHGDRALLGAHEIEQPALVLNGQLAAGGRHHEGERGQALLAVRRADHQHIADRRVRRERLVAQHRAFDLFGPHAVARDIDDVVRAPVEREGAVFMRNREIALGIGPGALPTAPITILPAGGIAAPCGIDTAIGNLEAFDVAPDCAREVGIGRCDHDFALLARLRTPPRHAACIGASEGRNGRHAVLVRDPHIADNPRQRIGVRIGAQREVVIAEHMRPGDPAVFGRPVGVNVARRYVLHPEGLHGRRDRLGAEGRDPKAAHVVALELGQVRRIGHDRLEEGHARLEDADIVPLDHRGEAACVREHRRAFGDEARHPRHQRRANQVTLPGNPARIGDHEQRIARARVEARRHRLGHARGIAVRMDNALGLAGAARGVDEEHRVIGIDRQGLR